MKTIRYLSIILASLCILCGHSSAAAPKPNVVLILIDDFGYECVTANGGESYRTPVMDQLAADWPGKAKEVTGQGKGKRKKKAAAKGDSDGEE